MPAAAVVAAGALAAGATIYSAKKQSDAAKEAAEIQQESALTAAQYQENAAKIQANALTEMTDKQIAAIMEQYYTSREDLMPWTTLGAWGVRQAANKLLMGPGTFDPTKEPGYQFGYQEFVEKPLMSQASARGRLFDPSTQKALSRYAQDYATTGYGNWLNRYYASLQPYFQLAGLGAGTAGQTAQQGAAAGGQIGQAYGALGQNLSNVYGNLGAAQGQMALYGGQAAAQGLYGQANALTAGAGGLSKVANQLAGYYALSSAMKG